MEALAHGTGVAHSARADGRGSVLGFPTQWRTDTENIATSRRVEHLSSSLRMVRRGIGSKMRLRSRRNSFD